MSCRPLVQPLIQSGGVGLMHLTMVRCQQQSQHCLHALQGKADPHQQKPVSFAPMDATAQVTVTRLAPHPGSSLH